MSSHVFSDKRIADEMQLESEHAFRRWCLELKLVHPIVFGFAGVRIWDVGDFHGWDNNAVQLLVSNHDPPLGLSVLENGGWVSNFV